MGGEVSGKGGLCPQGGRPLGRRVSEKKRIREGKAIQRITTGKLMGGEEGIRKKR